MILLDSSTTAMVFIPLLERVVTDQRAIIAEVTGKPSGDDLREGKLTALVAYAFQAGGPAVSRLKTLLGRPGLAQDDIDEARDLLRRTGAVDRVEADIAENLAAALDVVDSAALTEDGTVALRRLAHLAATRSL